MFKMLYPFVFLLKKSKNLSALACRLTQLTGKSKYQLHPKHLLDEKKLWCLKNIKANDLILDLGCGNGQHTLKIAKKCKKVIGLDYNQKNLKIARKIAPEKQIKNVQFRKFNLEKKLPFKQNSFDKVLCLDVLEHVTKRKKLLAEIKRVLKSKGLVFISVPNKNTSWKKLQRRVGLNSYADSDHKKEYALPEIKSFLKKGGFKILTIKPIVYDTPWAGFIDIIGGVSLSLYQEIGKWKKNKVKNNLSESSGFRIVATKFFLNRDKK